VSLQVEQPAGSGRAASQLELQAPSTATTPAPPPWLGFVRTTPFSWLAHEKLKQIGFKSKFPLCKPAIYASYLIILATKPQGFAASSGWFAAVLDAIWRYSLDLTRLGPEHERCASFPGQGGFIPEVCIPNALCNRPILHKVAKDKLENCIP
jgi:hypothetical protein